MPSDVGIPQAIKAKAAHAFKAFFDELGRSVAVNCTDSGLVSCSVSVVVVVGEGTEDGGSDAVGGCWFAEQRISDCFLNVLREPLGVGGKSCCGRREINVDTDDNGSVAPASLGTDANRVQDDKWTNVGNMSFKFFGKGMPEILCLLWRAISKHRISFVDAAHLLTCRRPVSPSSENDTKHSDSQSADLSDQLRMDV